MNVKYNAFDLCLGKERFHLSIPKDMRSERYVWSTNRHCHAAYELHVILQGNGAISVEDKEYPLQPKSAILIASGLYHYPVRTSVDFTRFSISFMPKSELMKQHLKSKTEKCIVFSAAEHLCRICDEVYFESAAGNPYRSDLQQALLTQLLIYVFRGLQLWDKPNESKHVLSDTERFLYIDDFFEFHFTESAGEELLAEQLGFSKRQLTRVLQKHYGMGYRQKLICARMDRAAWLLRTTKKSVFKVAEEVGYASESSFYQAFRQHFHMTPQQYRSRNVDRQANP